MDWCSTGKQHQQQSIKYTKIIVFLVNKAANKLIVSCDTVFFFLSLLSRPEASPSHVAHHGGEQFGQHLDLCLLGCGVRRRRVAREPLPALSEACLGLHAGQLHQVSDCHLGVALCP